MLRTYLLQHKSQLQGRAKASRSKCWWRSIDVLRPEWFEGVASVGVTAGASAPEMLVQGVLDGLRRFGEIDISTLAGVAEDVRFRFPKELIDA